MSNFSKMKAKNRYAFGNLQVAIAVSVLFLSLTACTDVRLSTATKYYGLSSAGSPVTYLKRPETDNQNIRFVVFVDMSNSMVMNYCQDDIEDPEARVTPPAGASAGGRGSFSCNPFANPADPQIDRLKSVSGWIQSLITQLPPANLSRLKILVVPFTGGYVEAKRDSADATSMAFLEPDRANDWVQALIKQQMATQEFQAVAGTTTAANDPAAEDPMFMGTSVPGKRLATLRQLLQTEIDELNEVDELKNTNFQLVFISDGNPVPTTDHFVETINRIWNYKIVNENTLPPSQSGYSGCVQVCQTYLRYVLDPLNSADFNSSDSRLCSDYSSTGSDMSELGCPLKCIFGLGEAFSTSKCGDANNTLSVMRESWGNEQGNKPLDIIKAVNEIRTLLRKNSEANFNFHFFMSDQNRRGQDLSSRPDSDYRNNWILYARKAFKRGANHRQIMSDQEPLDFIPLAQQTTSWRLKHIFAVNTTGRVDRYGKLSADSDADGLFDYEESVAASSNPRTNGVCLDAIRVKNGCIMPGTDNEICDPKLDEDGDGLNACEEKTLGTDRYDFDTDNDAIPDSLEVLYGLNPLGDDGAEDWSSDGISNFEQFQMGLSPQVRAPDVSSQAKTSVSIELARYKPISNGPSTVLVAGYRANVTNMPIANVRVATDGLALYRTEEHLPSQRVTRLLVGGSHSRLTNRVLYLAFVENVSNPGLGYWMAYEDQIGFGARGLSFGLDRFKEMFARDPLGDYK